MRQRELQLYEAVKRLFKPAALEAVLFAGSALMLVPFSWMLTVSLKSRRAVFAGQNFLPSLKLNAAKLATDTQTLILAVLGIAFLITAVLASKNRSIRSLALIAGAILLMCAVWSGAREGALTGLDFSAYSAVWRRVPFARMLANSFIVALTVTALQLLTSSLAGYAFSRLNFPGRDKLFWAYASLMLIPQQATLIPAFMLIKRLGLIDTYAALVLPFAAAPFGAFLMRQFFIGLPKELEEAAVLDGCSRLGVLFKIFVPLAKPALSTLALFSFMNSWNEFLWPLMVTTRREMFTLQVGLDMLKWESGSDWPVIMAASVIVTLPVIAAFLAAQGKFTHSISTSGINM